MLHARMNGRVDKGALAALESIMSCGGLALLVLYGG